MKTLTTLVCVLALLGTSAAVFAQDDEARHSFFTDKLQISAGAFIPNFNTDVKLDGDNLTGTTVDFEKLLGLDDQIVTPFVNLIWRINDRHRLDFMYYNLDRDGTLALNNNINFGDETFSVGTEMESSLDMSIYRLGYDYSLINDKRLEFGVGISADIIPADFSVKAQTGASESESVVLFVPTFGVHAAVGITEKLLIRGKIQGLVYDVDNQDGDVINGILGFEYDAFKHFSLGLGYAYYDFDVDLDTSGFQGSIAFVYRGPLVYGTIHF